MTPLQDPVASAPSDWVRTHLNLSAPTPRTLRFLRAVLGLASFDECESKAACASTKKARQVKGSSISRPPIRHATRNRQKPGAVIQIHETNDEKIPRLSETERRKIATDTFNSTLKCLGEAAKALREAPATKTESSVNPNNGPLQERSPNKERRKPALDSKKSTICNAPTDSGLLADLSYSALLFLRRSDHKDVVSTAGNNAELENAALILLDRSISLNLIKQAQRQLCDIHERYWGDEVRKKSSSQSNIAKLLLGRPDAADEDRRFRFTASLQSQALRLALLVGPKCIDSELLKSLQPDAIGSPAWVTSRALENKLLTSEQSGLQLRTISLALSKLYALATSSKGENSSPLDLFKLFCLSLRIKFESWVHSGHLPSPPTEVWHPLHRAIKQLFATTKDLKASTAYTFQALGSIQKLTRPFKCEFNTPPDMIGTLLQVIRDPDEYPQLIALVEERLRQTSGASHLILRCQITLSRLRASSRSTKTLESLKSMGSALAEPRELPPADLDKFLLLLAQLRKAAAELISFDKTRPHMEANGPLIDFQTTLIRFTYCSFNFLRRHIRSILILSSENSSVEKRKAFLTTLLKTIDAVLSAEQFAITQDADLVAAASEALEDCSAAVQTLQVECAALMTQCRLETSLNQLRVRISQLFWARYLEAVKESKTPLEQSRILGMSLLGLLDLPLADQKVAHVALKYERLAACYLEERDFRTAETALRTAIEISIKDGVLGDVADLLLSVSFHRAWSHSDLGCKALGRVLTTYSKAILDHTPISESESESESFYDDPSLPSLHRAVLLEKQLLAMVDLGMNDHRVDLCATMANTLLSLLPQPVYLVYSMRVINQLLQLALKKKVPVSATAINSSVICRILDADLAAENVFLSRYEPELRSLLSLQYGFLTGVLSNQTVSQGVKQLCEIVRTCKTHQETHVKCLDVGAYIAPLLLSVEYAAILGNYDVSLMALEALQHLVELGVPIQEISYKRILLRKGQFHDLLKDPQSAQKAFATIENAPQEENDPLFETELALTYSEHHLYAEDLDASNKWLVIARNAWQARERPGNSKSTKARLREQIMWCRAAHLASRLAFESSQLADAIVLARQSAKISATIWSSIERVCASAPPAHSNGSLDHELHCVSFELSRLDLSSPPSVRLTSSAVVLGSEVSLCCSVFSYMAFLNAHCGVYQDAVMFYEQTLKIAQKWGHSIHTIIALSELGLLHARAGQVEKAQNSLQELPQIARDYHASWIRGHVALNQVETCLVLGDGSAASRCLIEAKQLPVDKDSPSVELAVSEPLKDRSVCASAKPTGRKRGVKGQKGIDQIKRPPKKCPPASKSTLDLSGFNARISFLESRLQIFLGCANPADRFDTSSLCDKDDDCRKTTSIALSLVHSALRSFSEDSIHNVLAETAVAIPVRYRSARKSGRVSLIQGGASRTFGEKDQDQKKRSRQKQAAKTFKDGTALLLQAYDILWEVSNKKQNRVPCDIVHTCHKLLIQISLLSSALNQPLVSSSSNVVLNMTTPLDVALTRERFVTLGELSAAKKMSTESWPSTHNSDNSHICLMSDKLLDYDTSLLPASWSVISLGLNEDRNELFVAQLAYQRSPFVVRIPLARPDPSEGDSEELDLKSAKAEIQEIIMKANASAHDARGSSVDKSVRKEWYVERQALDRQLATLLENIENIWFGGFRGLLSAGHIEEGELRKFGRCLTSTLHRHLPSRQKSSKSCEHVVELHDHVLELFVALGHPREVELEDAVTDLLYFVIDILQFNGERNAYDEIDFDAMLVEVLDALHSYHDHQSASRDKRGHVILVLDKELQAFPWESLSCLKNQGVSRMPSIASVWEKLKAIEDQRHDLKGYMIPRTDGAYILNPSSDLVATQETFGQIFENQLSNYRAIVNRHPEGNEFETALRDSSLMLYFGHGGGGQYIRPRTIRKMDKCAVTLLMGCSSAKMTECGVYEPHGMPLSYLSAGSPAVVGTLWDVTDRDIDRFAMELMADWGLIDADANSAVPTLNKGRNPKAGKENAARHQSGRQKSGKKSLDEAVAHARDACLLKYLNGAAPVMYGIPVFLG
ncbi:separase [Fonsecaea pedrosoi]|nr:separase [Fonsecaea pedrosoi]